MFGTILGSFVLVANVAAWAGGLSVSAGQMREPRLMHLPAFTVIGFAGRTTNAAEAAGKSVIGPTTGRFMSEGAKIPGVVDKNTSYAVYTSYESDFNGAYDYVRGYAVKQGTSAPDGMRSVSIPAANYLVFDAPGSSMQDVISTWSRIWKYFSGSAPKQRAYTADFEKYGEDGLKVYIAVK